MSRHALPSQAPLQPLGQPLPAPQVLITMQGNQVSIQSTVSGPEMWLHILNICHQGVLAAHEQVVKAKLQGGQPLVVVPTLAGRG